MKLLAMWILVSIAVASLAVIHAQQPSEAEKVAALEAQVKALQAKLQQPAVAEKFYIDAFRIAKSEAQQACKDAGGKLWVMVSRTPGQPLTSSVSCEMK